MPKPKMAINSGVLRALRGIGRKKKWEVLVDWDHTNESWEPLNEMRLADSITLAEYAIKDKLFYQPGWKWAKKKNKTKLVICEEGFSPWASDTHDCFTADGEPHV